VDQLLILSTPLLAIPAVYLLYLPLGVQAKTISLIVAAFFALGHHLPGMMRAYGDRELFERFRTRFILAPLLLIAAILPLKQYHPDFMPLVIVFWATWHGLMQLYGFMRIYDSKVGSTSPVTAWWDWLACFCGFFCAQMFCPSRITDVLRHWYGLGGPLISPGAIHAAQWISLVASIVVLVGFCANYILQTYRGVRPNPVKLLLLVSGIGTWWFAIVYIKNIILGAAVFDICHDVQYLAIVWVFNCRRVSTNPNLGAFMSFVFRRGMAILYVGLIAAYGAIGIIPVLVENGTVIALLNGIIGTSTLLHYYYDGFIWKVREKSTQASLGLNPSASVSTARFGGNWGVPHLLKWSPLILAMGWLFLTDFISPSVAQSRKTELGRLYTESLTGSAVLPKDEEEISWLFTQFEQAQTTAKAVPNDPDALLRAAIILANFGRNDEAVDSLNQLLKRYPEFYNGYLALGEIHLYRGNFDQAESQFKTALGLAPAAMDRAVVNLKLGVAYLKQKKMDQANEKFREAVRDNPQLQAVVDELGRTTPPHNPTP